MPATVAGSPPDCPNLANEIGPSRADDFRVRDGEGFGRQTIVVLSWERRAHCGHHLLRCKLKYSGLIFHDLRRCWCMRLDKRERAQKTALMITGIARSIRSTAIKSSRPPI
jgi:hypothetical protein